MPICCKCWKDAGCDEAFNRGDRMDHYFRLLESRSCTPEEQCGDEHTIVEWDDRPDQCRCGKVVKDEVLPSRETDSADQPEGH